MKLIRLCFIALLLFCIKANAQVSGYLGKKTIVGLNFGLLSNYSSYLADVTQINYSGAERTSFFSFTPSYGLSIKQVINQNNSLDFSYSRSRNGIYKALTFDDQISYSHLTGNNLFDFQNGVFNVYTLAISNSDAASPMGLYNGLGISLMNAKMKTVDVNGNEYKLDNYVDYGIYLSGGLRRVYYDKLLIDMGIDVNLFAYNLAQNFFNRNTSSSTGSAESIDYARLIFLNNLISCRVGVNYLF